MPQTGQVLRSRYRLEGVLGAGGMATVHRATDLRLERPVAVKILLPNLARDPDLVARFEREARALAAVGHPAIVEIYDIEAGDPATGEEPFIVMELVEGGSLAEWLEEAGRLPPDEVVPLAARIAEGIAALHAAGIVHRDVKPQNILLSSSGPKLADFGIARFGSVTLPETLTAAGTVLGSVAYSPPELLAGEPATGASDTYGLGTVVYQALTGRRPRDETNLAEAIEARLRPPGAPSAVSPDLAAFDDALAAALSPDPNARPEPLAFATALTRALRRWELEPHDAEGARHDAEGARHDAEGVPHDAGVVVPAVPKPPGSDPPLDATDAYATTLVEPAEAVAIAGPPGARRRPWQPSTATDWPTRRRSLVALTAGGLVIVVLVIVAVTSLADLLGSSDASSPPPGSSPSPGSLSSPTAVTSPSPSPSTSPPSPSPDAGPTSVEDALVAVRDALRDASATLDRKDAARLAQDVDEIERAVAKDDIREAIQLARDLTKRVAELIREGKIEGDVADRLDSAANALLGLLRAGTSGG